MYHKQYLHNSCKTMYTRRMVYFGYKIVNYLHNHYFDNEDDDNDDDDA
jgi:hypothetical protein